MSTDKLAKGWRRVKFGDVVRKVSDRVDPDTATIERYVAGEHMGTDDLTIRRWGQVGDGYLGPAFHMRFKPGQVLYGSRRTYLRKVAVADFEGITANTTFVLEPSSKDLLPEFLPLVMTTEVFHEHSIKQSKGSVNPYINFSDLTWYEFALPPVNEQRRLVEILHVAEEARLRSAIARQAIDTLIESFAQEAVRGAEGASLMLGEIVNLARETIDPSRLPSIQVLEHWSIPNLDEFGRGVSEPAGSIGSLKKRVLVPSVLVSMLNPRIPRLAIVDGGQSVVCSTEFAVYYPASPALNRDYLAILLRSRDVWTAINRSVRGSTKSRERANGEFALNVRVPLPSLEAQSDAVTVFRSLVDVRSSVDMLTESSRKLLTGLRESCVGGVDVH